MRSFSNRSLLFSVILISAFGMYACTNDSEEDIFGDGCSSTKMSFSQDITPILSSQCFGCHSTAAKQGGIILDTYEDVKSVVDNEKLAGAIQHLDGYSKMPLGGIKMDDCSIEKITSWISEGAENN